MEDQEVRLAALKRRLRNIRVELERVPGLDIPQPIRDHIVKVLTEGRDQMHAEIKDLTDAGI